MLIAAVFLAVLAALVAVVWLKAGRKRRARTPDEVAGYIRAFLNEEGGPNDWDDFISVPIQNPALEEIRREAERIVLPLERGDEARLRAMLKKVEALN